MIKLPSSPQESNLERGSPPVSPHAGPSSSGAATLGVPMHSNKSAADLIVRNASKGRIGSSKNQTVSNPFQQQQEEQQFWSQQQHKFEKFDTRPKQGKPRAVPLPFPFTANATAASTTRSRFSGNLNRRMDLSDVLLTAFTEQRRTHSEKRARCHTSQGVRHTRKITSPILSPKGPKKKIFASKALGEQVSVLEALHARPATSCGVRKNLYKTTGDSFGGPVEMPSWLPSNAGNNRAGTQSGAAILKCLNFIENTAFKGMLIDSSDRKNLVLSKSLDVIRQSLFSNWLQVSNDSSLQPVPFAELSSELEERSNKDQVEIKKLQGVVMAAQQDIENLREKLRNIEASNQSACDQAEILRAEKAESKRYIARLRKDLMTSFDDLKHMEEQKDAACAKSKSRSLELSNIERKLAQNETVFTQMEEQVRDYKMRLATMQDAMSKKSRENHKLKDQIAQMENLL